MSFLLRQRRLLLWQKNARWPAQHLAVAAVLAGDIDHSPNQLTGRFPSCLANPWLRLAWRDFCSLGSVYESVRTELTTHGWSGLPCCLTFLGLDLGKLPGCVLSSSDRHLVHAVARQVFCEERLPAGGRCGARCSGPEGLAMHRYHALRVSALEMRAVVTNQCPRCLTIFVSTRQARLHLARFFPSDCCPKSPVSWPLLLPASLTCPLCDFDAESWLSLQLHVRRHLNLVVR